MHSDFGKIDVRKPDFIPLHGSFSVVCWWRTPELANDHDFRTLVDGIVIFHGAKIFTQIPERSMRAPSTISPILRLDALQTGGKRWQQLYPDVRILCILSDSGASNGYRPRAWKYCLQHRFANPFQVLVTVTTMPVARQSGIRSSIASSVR